MKNKKIIALVIFLIIIIFATIIIAFSMYNSDQDENLNEANMQNSNNVEKVNILENNDVSENQTDTELVENDTQTSEINNDQVNVSEGSENMNSQREEIKINLIVNNKTFTATLNNNETTRELTQMFPMTLDMSDLHSNEKYNYLDSSFTTNSSRTSRINAGDIKLYGNNCLVVFYESFSNSYSYTDLGRVDDVDEFVSELGSGSVNIRFELAN